MKRPLARRGCGGVVGKDEDGEEEGMPCHQMEGIGDTERVTG